MSRVAEGIVLGLLAIAAWRSQRNPPKVYLGEQRIHHGAVGTALTLFAKDPLWRAFGAVLALDDLKDAKDWLLSRV